MLTPVFDALFPQACEGCGEPGPLLCGPCLRACALPREFALDGLTVRACGAYAGPLKATLLALKSGRRPAAAPLAALLVAACGSFARAGAALVAVPTTPERRRERGYDQAVVLADALGVRIDRPVLGALRRVGDDAQRGRSRSERLAACNRFACDGKRVLSGSRVVLVDDVCTTGATLRDAAATLRRSGVEVARAVVVARA